MPNEGRQPFRERKEEPRTFAVGENVPKAGQAPARSDEDIRRDVETALFYDEAVSSIGINVGVTNGSVTMDGKTTSDLAKRLAGEDAWTVPGVKNVQNNLTVEETPTPSRAAGQDLVDAKPPEPIYGEPPEREASAGGPAGGGKTRAAGQGTGQTKGEGSM
jgi:hypothetical protein